MSTSGCLFNQARSLYENKRGRCKAERCSVVYRVKEFVPRLLTMPDRSLAWGVKSVNVMDGRFVGFILLSGPRGLKGRLMFGNSLLGYLHSRCSRVQEEGREFGRIEESKDY